MENLLYTINFKRIALTNKITARDAAGQTVSYSHQKMLKLKEKVLFYADENKTRQIAEINADRVIDFNVKYSLVDDSGNPVYTLNRIGRQSIWKANYQISKPDGTIVANVNEKNAWTKIMDSLFSGLPIIGALSGYVFHAEYIVSDANGSQHYTIKKKPALFESNFDISSSNGESMDLSMLQILIMFIMRERSRS